MEHTGDARQRALALLEAQHAFPGAFEFRVVIRPEGRAGALGALLAAAGGGEVLLDVTERPSSAGKYVSLRVKVHLDQAEKVLDVYEVLRQVEHVITVL